MIFYQSSLYTTNQCDHREEGLVRLCQFSLTVSIKLPTSATTKKKAWWNCVYLHLLWALHYQPVRPQRRRIAEIVSSSLTVSIILPIIASSEKNDWWDCVIFTYYKYYTTNQCDHREEGLVRLCQSSLTVSIRLPTTAIMGRQLVWVARWVLYFSHVTLLISKTWSQMSHRDWDIKHESSIRLTSHINLSLETNT